MTNNQIFKQPCAEKGVQESGSSVFIGLPGMIDVDEIEINVPAKINLYLKIIRKRPDGYHDIDTLMQTVSLYDKMILKKSDGIELTVDGLSEIEPKDNLAYKAARIVSEMVDYPGAQIILKKYIPTGAGLGGGSADAAFVVRGLMQLYGLKLERFELKRRMALLGADIPFFLGTGQSRATGIGDIIEPIDLPIDYQVLIVKPEISINTRWAYQNAKIRLTKNPGNIILDKRTDITDIVRVIEKIGNDFEETVFAVSDNLSRVKKQLIDGKALYVSISGSGSAMFGIFEQGRRLESIAARLSADGFRTFICKPIVLQPII